MESNFNLPQRQSPIGVLVMFVDSLQKIARGFWPIFLVWMFNSDKSNVLLVFLAILGFLVLVGIIAYLRFINFTFYIDHENDEFIIKEGIINKTITTIQLDKIQQVNINQNLIQRIINVYALDVDTAGSDKKEGNIKAISHELALALKAKLIDNENKKTVEQEETSNAEVSETKPFLKIKSISLLKVGITSNYIRSIGLIITFFFTITENLRNIGKEEMLENDKLNHFLENNPVIYSLFIGVVVIFIILFFINCIRTLIKYFDYSITKQKGSLLISYGLINTKSTILKPEKVQILSISRNYFQKKLNVLEIKIKQAVSNEKNQVKSQIEIPGCNSDERDEILKLIFKQLPEKGVQLTPNFRKLGFSIFLIIVLPLTVFFSLANTVERELFEYMNFAFGYAVFFLIVLFFGFRNYRLFINENHIIKQSGAWDVTTEIIEIKKIQALTSSQLFWHKNLNIGSLTMHTAGGKLTFYLGNYTKVKEYMNLWLYELETSDSNWM